MLRPPKKKSSVFCRDAPAAECTQAVDFAGLTAVNF